MEVVVLEDSPLAVYLEGEGQKERGIESVPSSPTTSNIHSFAPKGRPINPRLRLHVISPQWLASPSHQIASALHNLYSQTLDFRLSHADNARFLERFRYLIVASQLLNLQTYSSHSGNINAHDGEKSQFKILTPIGIALTSFSAFSTAWLINWIRFSPNSASRAGRLTVLIIVAGVIGLISYTYFRRQWLLHVRHETIVELSNLITVAYDLDKTVTSALSLIQEVELVSRGYQISPLPPISRIEDRSQTRRCIRLRTQVRACLLDVKNKYTRSCKILQPLAEELDLEKYYDIYDINDTDLSEIMSEKSELELEDSESVRALKILAVQCNLARKIFLCCLMALNTDGNNNDFHRWNVTFEEIQQTRNTTTLAVEQLAKVFDDEDNFLTAEIPKISQSPVREQWRAQNRHLGSLSLGIRGLQAKLHLLREESDRNFGETEDTFDVAFKLSDQYESLGSDLRALLQEWEDGKSTLPSNKDRNERRTSCYSGILSPTASLGGLTVVEENNGAIEALKALNGEVRSGTSIDFSNTDFEEVFEAISMPQKRASLSREERIAKIKDDRAKRYSARNFQDNNTKILRELESVIKAKPRNRLSVGARFSSM